MKRLPWLPLSFILIVLVFALFACEYLEETVNESTKQTKHFKEDLKPGIPIKGQDGACTPYAISFDSLLSVVPIWEDVKEHIEKVRINELLYTVDPNKNTSDGKVNIYITDSGDYFKDANGAPPESDRIGSTATIEAGKTYSDEPILYAEGGLEALEELMMDFEREFHICAGWDGNEEDVDMTFLLTVDADVVFVPL